MVYIFLALFTLLVFGATASDNVMIGGSVGNVHRNSPYTLAIFTSILSIFGLLVATAFFNNAALRDHSNNFNEILFTTPLSKAGYFFGRFFGALILSTIPLLGIFLGSYIGTISAPAFGWIEAERFGEFSSEMFINNYFLFILPNMFFAGAIIFATANKWKSTVISFTGAFLIIIGYIISSTLMSDIDNETIAGLVDVFGINSYSLESKYYTAVERNTLSPGFNGILLTNRLIWTGVGILILIVSYTLHSFKEKNKKLKKQKASKAKKVVDFNLPELNLAFNGHTEWLHLKSFFKISFLSIVKSVTFKIMFLFSAILLVTDLFAGFEYYGLKSYPLTYKVIDSITDSTSLFLLIILVFFSGELIWRDRDSKINEVMDSSPHTSFISLAAKALSLIAATSILNVFFIICGVIYQLLNGYTRIELNVYLLDFFYTNLWAYVIFSGVMIMIQVLVNNKYIGYFVSILLIFVWSIMLSIFDVESAMLHLGEGPSLMYSDMNGFGPGLLGAFWFNLYWVLLSILALLLAGAVWNRGMLGSLKSRIVAANKQVPKNYKYITLSVFVVWAAVAGFVYYNTQILNPYDTSDEREQMAVDYETKYKKYEHVAMPKITDAKYFIDIYPYKRDAKIKAILKLTNETDVAIDSLHLSLSDFWETELNIPNAKLVHNDEELDYVIYQLEPALQPQQTIEVEVRSEHISLGFSNSRGNTSIINNGTFLNNMEVLPGLGYNPAGELSDKNDRKKHDLPPKDRMPALTKDSCKYHMANYLTDGRSDFINVETVISTAGDQTAIAPGSLLKQWTEDGRNYYHYKVDHPSQNFYSFISARFEKATRKWNNVDIEVYYDAKHPQNIEMMMDAVERSLEYYSTNFGPYYHKQCRIIEFPRYSTFAQAFPGTMPYSESIGFVIDLEGEDTDNNIVDEVIAHEMAHQWWAHQVIGAHMQGSTLMSESFSEYSALMTMKQLAETPMKMREFLKYNHNSYLRGRGQELEKELPLYKVENQGYIHYRKGSVVLYALQDYIGEDKVNQAMRDYLNEYKYKGAPYYSTSLDFLDHLEPQVPDSLQYLITDWFKEITLYDNRVKEANYKELDNGKYEVTMEINSHKIKADSLGNENRLAMNDWVDIGFFLDDDEEQLYQEKRVLINQDVMNFSFVLDTLPAKAAIDPRHLLIDRVYSDNIKTISEE